MSAATRALPWLAAIAAAGCGAGSDEQNIVISNGVPEDAEIEVLPADESASAPSDDLASGAADAQANETVANGY